MTENVLLDFDHTYAYAEEAHETGPRYMDLSDITGTDMFCTQESADKIRNRLQGTGPGGIHFLDNGNYHYATLFFVEKIREPFTLVLIDHHTDMQKPLISHLLSCGSWAGTLLLHNRYLRQLILIGPEKTAMESIEERFRSKLICISMEQIGTEEERSKFGNIDLHVPVYISIDKDVLSPYYARTNWNQGEMTVDILEKLLLEMFVHQRVIGVDICGECSLQEPLPKLTEDTKINLETNKEIYKYIKKLIGLQKAHLEEENL